ncbi:MAG: ABC transporter substrate-binding protein [Armatimonadetes bacterium]|nr:ABC transporter substrate-binding protein [Armatimonadota bacterium]MDW8154907.1 ABC transporter substrate-binding protein [Armatimonadota bacterium]
MRRWLRGALWTSFLVAVLFPRGAATGPSLRERICEAAQKEGVVHILTNVREVADPLEKALNGRFPWLRVRTVTDVAAPTRAVAEAQAGRHEHDVFAYSLPGILPAYERGLLVSFSDSEIQTFGIHPGARLLGGAVLSGWTFVHTIAHDTRRVRSEEAPRRWEDLLTPRWRGRLVGSISALTNGVAAVGLLLGEAWAFDFVRKLRDEVKVTLTPSPTLALQLVLQGEKDLLWSGIETTLERQERAVESARRRLELYGRLLPVLQGQVR